jgi:hypothetical protein
MNEEATENCPINDDITVDQVRQVRRKNQSIMYDVTDFQEPYNMPTGFEWCSIDVTDPAQVRNFSLKNIHFVSFSILFAFLPDSRNVHFTQRKLRGR